MSDRLKARDDYPMVWFRTPTAFERTSCLVLMLLAAVAAACTLVALAQLDLGWALGLAALALASFEAALFVTSKGDTR